jgi:hypothetical protein
MVRGMMDTKPKPKTAAAAPEAPQFGTCAHCTDDFATSETFNAHLPCNVERANAPQTQHTPTPWSFREGSDPHQQSQIYGDDGKTIAITYSDEDGSNAALIVRAVNSHEELLAACKAASRFIANLEKLDIVETKQQFRA